ncbi:YybH family protein [Fodinicurvata sediminis]|uniref:YybH family protein n=1 Tax=Fodinicurvata sediminis TaxID=1121832 RepID=UPI0003B3C157|nr:SgcJ/EcaC family oxidoreductase [Fodinicurvata sediminis]
MDSDEKAIETTMGNLLEGFRRRDADILKEVYSEDADWTNAFGRTLKGRDAIVDYLRELFADSNFSDGEMKGAPEVDVRQVSENVVLVKTYMEVTGQKTVDGGTLPTRRNHSLKVLKRQYDGSWRIVSEIYMDARDEVTHRH